MHAPPFIPQELESAAASQRGAEVNVASNERLISLSTGGLLLLNSLVGPRRSRPLSFVVAAGLLYRGFTGHCHAYEMLGIDTAQRERVDEEETQVQPD